MNPTKEVSKEEFTSFIETYPNKLEQDVAQFFEPPLITFNDLTDGKMWPDSVIAHIIGDKYYIHSEVVNVTI